MFLKIASNSKVNIIFSKNLWICIDVGESTGCYKIKLFMNCIDLDNVNHPVHYKMKCLDSIKYYIGVFVLESFCFL